MERLGLVTSQTQPCRPRPPSRPIPQPTCTGPQAAEPVWSPHWSRGGTAPRKPSAAAVSPREIHSRHLPTSFAERHTPWASPPRPGPRSSHLYNGALGPSRRPPAPPPPASGVTGPEAPFANKPRACRDTGVGPGQPVNAEFPLESHRRHHARGQLCGPAAWSTPDPTWVRVDTPNRGCRQRGCPVSPPSPSKLPGRPRVQEAEGWLSTHGPDFIRNHPKGSARRAPRGQPPKISAWKHRRPQGGGKSMENSPSAACPAKFSREFC